jgi:hypothetical protein
MKTRLFLVAVAATASLAGCGADNPKSDAAGGQGQEAANRKAMLDYAACMRKNGVDMPDPQFSAGRATQRMNKANPDTMRTAEAACAKIRDKIKAPEMSDADKAQFKKAALANARCMRKHGIDKFPDPTFSADGGARVKFDRGINPESARFKAAQKACRDTLPGGGPSTTDAGGDEK